MPLSNSEAKLALDDIARVGRRSFNAHGYAAAAPQLMLWGVLWLLGYGGTYFFHTYAGWIWIGIIIAGSIGSFWIGISSKPVTAPKFSWRIFFTWLAALGAISSVLAIFAPFTGTQIGTLFPLIAGWSYVFLGVWLGPRFVVAGLLIVGLTLFGFFGLSPEHFILWMAFVGSVTLIGTGLWLRRA
ncbi:MAG: hypothetical protein ACP5QR_02930 [Rhizomicrobium sp.]